VRPRSPRFVRALGVGAFALACGACYDADRGQELLDWTSAGHDGGSGSEGDEGGSAPAGESGADPSASQGDSDDHGDDGDDTPAAPPAIKLLSVNGDAKPGPIREAMAATIAVVTDDDAAVTRVELSVAGEDAPMATLTAPPFTTTWLIDDLVARKPRSLTATAFIGELASAAVTLPITFALPPSGSQRWRRGAAAGPASDQVTGVAIASDGDVIMVGFQTEPQGQRSRVTLSRHSPVDGHSRWQQVLPEWPAQGEHYRGRGLALSAAGELLVAADVSREGAAPQLWLGRFDAADGALLRAHEGQSSAGERARALVATSEGGAVIVGQRGEALSGELLLRRYSADFGEQWTRSQKGEVTAWSVGQGLCAGKDGSLYIVGSEAALGGDRRLLVSSYSSDGALLWGSSLLEEQMEREDGAAVALNSLGELVVDGSARAIDDASGAIAVRRLRADDGAPISFIRLNGYSEGDGTGQAVALDRHDRIYIAATLLDGEGAPQGVTVKLSRDSGAVRWVLPHEGLSSSEAHGASLVIDTIGYVFLGGNEIVKGAPRWWAAALNP